MSHIIDAWESAIRRTLQLRSNAFPTRGKPTKPAEVDVRDAARRLSVELGIDDMLEDGAIQRENERIRAKRVVEMATRLLRPAQVDRDVGDGNAAILSAFAPGDHSARDVVGQYAERTERDDGADAILHFDDGVDRKPGEELILVDDLRLTRGHAEIGQFYAALEQ